MLANDDYKKFLDDYSAIASESSQRSRYIALLLIFTSIISFVALRNSQQSGYFVRNYQKLHQQWNKAIEGRIKANKSTAYVDIPYYQVIIKEQTKDNSFLWAHNIRTRQDYEDYDKIYTDLLKEALIVRVPVLGSIFHINDLALISGVTILTLFLIFYYSLKNESENLATLMREAEGIDNLLSTDKPLILNHLKHYYDLQSARQLLTITPDIAVSSWVKFIPKLLSSMPSFVYLAIVLHDVATNDLDSGSFSPTEAWDVWLSFLLCIIIYIVNILCVQFSAVSDDTWLLYYKKLKGIYDL